MKIDILFFNEEFTNKDKFITDPDLFNEYINTHLFDGKSKDILLMPPSLSSRGNETILVASEHSNKRELMNLGYSIGKKIKNSATIDILNFEGSKEILSLGIMFSTYKFDIYKTKK
jgi:hypothetical protein